MKKSEALDVFSSAATALFPVNREALDKPEPEQGTVHDSAALTVGRGSESSAVWPSSTVSPEAENQAHK